MIDFGPQDTAPLPSATAERDADTHGSAVTAALATAAGDTSIGTITLPADGEWSIFGLWAQLACATATAAERIGGTIRMNALNGDIDPNPAPTLFPVPSLGSFLGATHSVSYCPLDLHPIRYVAPGKAQIELIFNNPLGSTVAPICVAGIIFGKSIPTVRPSTYADRVRAQVTSATETSVGTITLAEKATRITSIYATLTQDNVLTTAEELIGWIRLDSDDIKMTPAIFPCSAAYGAGLGALIGNTFAQPAIKIPVSIPVSGGARINCFVDLVTAVTNAAEVTIGLTYE